MEIASSVRRVNRQIHEGNQVCPDVELCFPVVGNLATLIPDSYLISHCVLRNHIKQGTN